MECVKEDLHTAGILISRYGITSGRQRVLIKEIAGDRIQWTKLVVAVSTTGTNFVMTTDLT